MRPLAAGIALALIVARGIAGEQAADPLAEMRRAIGDEAALARVSSFNASGSMKSTFDGRSIEVHYEMQCRLADQFVVTTSQIMNVGPLGSGTMVNRNGFDGDTLIAEISNDLGLPTPPAIFHAGPQPTTPAEIDADRRRRITGHRERMVHFTIPMFGVSFPGLDLSFKDAGEVVEAGRRFSVVEVARTDGFVQKLFIDQSTHLPSRLTWMAPQAPTATFSTSSMVSTRGGQVVNRSDDPVQTLTGAAAPTGLVEHEMTFGEFKADAGFTWPHRFTTKIAGKVSQDIKLGKFKVKSKS
jgi:hypothetical protein